MNEIIREEIWEKAAIRNFQKVFQDPGLAEILEAFDMSIHQIPILILFTGDMERGDDWHYLSTFPGSIFKLPAFWKKRQHLKTWSRFLPHLICPVKTVIAGGSIYSWLPALVDFFYGNDYQKKSALVKLKDIPIPGISFKEASGWLFQDFKVNLSRIKMEILKEISNCGGLVLNKAQIYQAGGISLVKDSLTDSQFVLNCQSINITRQKKGVRYVSELLPWPDFSMHIQTENRLISLFDSEGKLAMAGLRLPDLAPVSDLPEFLTQSDLKWVPETCHAQGEYKILYEGFPGFIRKYRMDCVAPEMASRPVEELLETAFDLAKQTGIGFFDFRKLYFRYGGNMEWLTEKAYERMHSERDFQKIWCFAEQEYIRKYEWGLPDS